jgi:glycosyltransferase involved in cell wall biosynthesis
LKIAATGFVAEAGGSVTSANALLLRELLRRGHEVDFFSKSSFVDPRPVGAGFAGFRFVECDNRPEDRLRRVTQRIPGLGLFTRWLDAQSYARLLEKRVRRECRLRRYDRLLWMGDYAAWRLAGVPGISFAQGPPGTDARAFLERWSEVRRLGGLLPALRWWTLAQLRLSRLGLPAFRWSDHFILGSRQSKGVLMDRYGISGDRISTLPYPIDLNLFGLRGAAADRLKLTDCAGTPLRVLWLGRIVPRKRLDLFLAGAAVALRAGVNLQFTIVGSAGMVPGYERLIAAFPFPERLDWVRQISRGEVPELLHRHDVLCQPSDEENFGSSVAEAQACGLPVIVGRTNGNADYLCSRDTHLFDDCPEVLGAHFADYAARKAQGGNAWGDPAESRALAEREFAVERVTQSLEEILKGASGSGWAR